jgi:hypothetical protein
VNELAALIDEYSELRAIESMTTAQAMRHAEITASLTTLADTIVRRVPESRRAVSSTLAFADDLKREHELHQHRQQAAA